MKNGMEIDRCGTKCYYVNDKLHREDGPALDNDRFKEWWVNGRHHRKDGPAIETSSGHKMWYYEGEYVPVKSQEDFIIYLKLKSFW